jgi:hypothetical protein
MPKLSDLIPINLDSEKEKFFAANFKYNPQFIYGKSTSTEELTKYGRPKFWYLFLAKRILKKHLKEKDLAKQIKDGKVFLDQDLIEDLIEERLSIYNLQNEYKIVFSKNFISRIAVNNIDKLVKVRLPVVIDQSEIEAILNHEIDTHIVRQLNYERQTWFKNKKRNGFKAYLRTEEGLAAINELVVSEHKLAYKSAANYLAVDIALKKDFQTVFNFFYQIWQDSERAWTWTLKKKRGIEDTSKKGAFTKDLVYFEGFIEVLNYLKKNNCDPSELYCGKIDLKDIGKAKKLGLSEKIILPKVFVQNPEVYKRTVLEIIKNNLF